MEVIWDGAIATYIIDGVVWATTTTPPGCNALYASTILNQNGDEICEFIFGPVGQGAAGAAGTSGTSGTTPCGALAAVEFIQWEDDQLIDYTKTSGIDDPVIHFYNLVNAYDSPGVTTDNSIVLTLDPNLAATSSCTAKRNWKLIFPEYQRVNDGVTWTVEQGGVGVFNTELVQYQSGIVTPHVLELNWDPDYSFCPPVDIVFMIDNSGSIDGTEWDLMFDGIIQMIDNLQGAMAAGGVRIGMTAFAGCSPLAQLWTFSQLESDYTTIRNVALFYQIIANRPGTGGTTWSPGLDLSYDVVTDPLYENPIADKIVVLITDGDPSSDLTGSTCSIAPGGAVQVANEMKAGTWSTGVPVRIVGVAISPSGDAGLVPALEQVVSGTNPWAGNLFEVDTFGDFVTVANEITDSLICQPGGYRIVKYELENFMGDKYTPTYAIGHNFTSKIKNAVWFFDNVDASGIGSATIIPTGSVIFIKDAFVVPEDDLGGIGTALSIGLSTVDNTGVAINQLTTDIDLTTVGVNSDNTLMMIRNPQAPSSYPTNGPVYGPDNEICFVRNSVPVMLAVKTDQAVSGGFWVVVPYMTLKPDYGHADIDTTYNLWITGGCGAGGGGGTSGTSGVAGTSGSSGTNGVAGTSGSSGTNGVAGTSGSSGTNGAVGTSGSSGTRGTSGVSVTGPAGTSGTSGDTTGSNFPQFLIASHSHQFEADGSIYYGDSKGGWDGSSWDLVLTSLEIPLEDSWCLIPLNNTLFSGVNGYVLCGTAFNANASTSDTLQWRVYVTDCAEIDAASQTGKGITITQWDAGGAAFNREGSLCFTGSDKAPKKFFACDTFLLIGFRVTGAPTGATRITWTLNAI
jgi:uncharacterized protein YegL